MINIKKIIETLNKKASFRTQEGYITRKSFAERKKEKNDKFIQGVLEELEANHNHSWFEELYLRNEQTLDDIALFYRGAEVTYGEMFEHMKEYAKALRQQGVEKGTEIPICMSNTPELVYLLGAISMVGAKANIFNEEFDPEYITEIIDGCNSEIMFVEDGKYEELKDSIDRSHISNIIMTSLTDSLPKTSNLYEEYDKKHGKFVNTVEEHKSQNSNIQDINEFVQSGKDYQGELISDVNLDDEFTITYSSGSTNSSRAKAIVHTVRSFITIGRCHDTDVQKSASMKEFTIQAQIPTHSNTDIIASISDSLMQGSRLALEPIYDKDFFIDSLLINRPNYVVATRSFWLNTMKKAMYDEKYKNIKMPFLLIPFSVGEPLERNEEKFINKGLRKVSAGRDKVPSPISPITMSVAGGDCEHGGIFWILFRALQSKIPGRKTDVAGMNPFQMVDVAVLDENGNYCEPYKMGRLVANSPCNMKCYKNNPEATDKFFITDATGKVWGDCNVYSFIDAKGGVHMKGRIPTSKETLPPFMIADTILKDTKNILSCEVIEDEATNYYVAHVELQPGKSNFEDILMSAKQRCIRDFGEEFASRIVYRLHSFDEAFELTGCGKRNNQALKAEGVTEKCVIPVEVGYDGLYKLHPVVSSPKVYKK